MRDDEKITLLIRPDLRQQLKVEAHERRLTMSRLVEVALVKLFGLSKGGKAQ